MRVRRLVFHGQSFLRLFTQAEHQRFRVSVTNALPPDAELCRLYETYEGRTVLVVRSESFDEVEDGAVIPEHPAPIFDVHYPKGILD